MTTEPDLGDVSEPRLGPEGRSCGEFGGELVEQWCKLASEGGVGAAEAAVCDEGFELEIIRPNRQTGCEVFLHAGQPDQLLRGECGPSLGRRASQLANRSSTVSG